MEGEKNSSRENCTLGEERGGGGGLAHKEVMLAPNRTMRTRG